ncbi:MAG: sensor histidine kinase [Anaerolineales bacterium]|nr:sensor histidine kinase [Anaerolineales bacterium]
MTLSYAIVTIGTVIVLAAILVGIAIYTESRANTQIFNSFYWSKTAFQDNIPFLLDDPKTLQRWIEKVQAEGFTWNDFQSYTYRESLDYANTLVEGSEPIYVLDLDLNLIAAAPLDEPSLIGKPFNPRLHNGIGMESIIEAALVGDKNYYAQSFTLPNGNYIAALPLRKTDDDPVVAIVIYTLKPVAFVPPINLSLYTTFFIVIFVIMLLVTPPVGAIFGWLASRDLRKRLVNLSVAARAWSKGDFSSTPRDNSADEIGELTRNLNNMAEQLQTLLHTRDELARVEERNRLARDLHDTVKQQTYAARMQLSAARNLLSSDVTTAAGHIDTALQLNRETQQELKLIIDELRPAALQGKGLAQALKEYADRWQEHTGIKVETVVSGERSLPLNVEQALYRVLQEALSNIARHAEADTVRLSLSMSLNGVTLVITDNGRGFDVNAVSSNSYGLTSMKARLSEVGGTLKVESTLSAGTTLTAEVKLTTRDTTLAPHEHLLRTQMPGSTGE